MISAALESTFQPISPLVPLINKQDQDRMKLQNNQTQTGAQQKTSDSFWTVSVLTWVLHKIIIITLHLSVCLSVRVCADRWCSAADDW